MKRRLAFLALPLVLAALVFGIKWRADHPTPTQEDLQIRALMKKANNPHAIQITYYPRISGHTIYHGELYKEESKFFINQLFTMPRSAISRRTAVQNGRILIYWFIYDDEINLVSIYADINFYNTEGTINLGFRDKREEHKLHPVTVKRWIEFLLSNPRIGPELRARLKEPRRDATRRDDRRASFFSSPLPCNGNAFHPRWG